ncbi:MAG TPA: tRNA (N6-isopentenyl adenosine(37)-C2)-methylthiotransferase MiaB, partial [Firmicutes bacterium]|nr:tRNA (N6-isopentenyl adenosine(37)-C2)-methylthiotransferase MiaB [Bacillota bacterium]
MKRSFHIINYGCQMNLRDGEIIATMLEDRGLSISDTLSEADIIIVNTCAVRERAVERALGRIKQLAGIKASRPGVIIAVGGCIAQTESDRILREAPFVDIVFGTR